VFISFGMVLFCLLSGKYEAVLIVSKYGGGHPIDNGVGSDGLYHIMFLYIAIHYLLSWLFKMAKCLIIYCLL